MMKEKKNKEKDESRFFFIFMGVLVAVLVIFMGFTVAGLWYTAITAKTETNVYPLLTTVTEVDRGKDLVTVEDNNGFIWQFEGVDDWEEGDLCNCLMNSRGTEKIFDDEIIMTRYEAARGSALSFYSSLDFKSLRFSWNFLEKNSWNFFSNILIS